MRRILFNLHLYAALVAGVFIAILGVTGAIMAFEPELDHVLHPHRSYVTPQGQPKSLAELAEAVGKVVAGKPVVFVLSTAPNLSYGVGFRDAFVSLNQYTGEVLDVDRSDVDFLGYVHQTHLRLATPLWLPGRDPHQVGKQIMSWSGVAALFLLLSGIYLWWPAKRVRVDWRSGERRSWFDLHNCIGIFSLVFLLILSVTGVVIGFERQTEPMFYRLTGSRPVEPPRAQVAPQPGATLITPDQALAIAREALPGASPVFVSAANPKQIYRVALRYPEDLTPGGRSRVYIDPYSGQVLQAESSRTTAAGTRLVNLNRALHTGDIFGIPSKTVMSLASLAIVAQLSSGLVMLWKRTRASRRAQKTQPPAAVAAAL